jgi:hypothetical protein
MVISTVVGGTLSEMTGGKFANGAVTSAMTYAASWGAWKIKTGGVSNASGGGKTDCSTEGTSEERQQRAEEAQKAVGQKAEFDDYYAGVVEGSNKIAFTTTDQTEFQNWISVDPKNRTVLHGRRESWLLFQRVRLFRSAVMGFDGFNNLPSGKLTGFYSPIENAIMVLGHEQGHVMGFENGSKYSSEPHVNSNLNGYNKCLAYGLCGGLTIEK